MLGYFYLKMSQKTVKLNPHFFSLFQDRHVKGANRDPQMDSSQDYHLQSGYENKTHTVLRFNRRYDTCDPRDLKITVNISQSQLILKILITKLARNFLSLRIQHILLIFFTSRNCEKFRSEFRLRKRSDIIHSALIFLHIWFFLFGDPL